MFASHTPSLQDSSRDILFQISAKLILLWCYLNRVRVWRILYTPQQMVSHAAVNNRQPSFCFANFNPVNQKSGKYVSYLRGICDGEKKVSKTVISYVASRFVGKFSIFLNKGLKNLMAL